MEELYLSYRKNDSLYELTTHNDILKITRDKEVLHIQLKKISSYKNLIEMGFKDENEIVGNFSEYISFCELHSPYNNTHFEDDEWSRHTKIYAEFYYSAPNGEAIKVREQIDSIPGEMANKRTDRAISEYYEFVRRDSSTASSSLKN